MDELPIDPAAQSHAILQLGARVDALRSIVTLLLADNAQALTCARKWTEVAAAIALNSMLTDSQIEDLEQELDGVLAVVDAMHERMGIDSTAPQPTAERPWAAQKMLVRA